MKKVYFIRHGQSEGNIGPIIQTTETPLSEEGIQQAQFVASRVAKLPIDLVVSSTMERAKQTAGEILKKKEVPIEYSDLFVERRRSSSEVGKPKDDPEVLVIQNESIEKFGTDFRHSDEEIFTDLKERANKALNYLRDKEEENIAVVSHGLFLRVIMAAVVHGEELTGRECWHFIRSFRHENTGITVLGYDEEKERWWLWSWNDHAHLSELRDMVELE